MTGVSFRFWENVVKYMVAERKKRLVLDVRTGAVNAPHPKYDKDFEPFTSDCGRMSKPIFKGVKGL